jgi:hypothetical protein
MTTTGRMKSSPLTHTIRAITTRRRGIRREDMARALKLRLWDNEANMEN